MHGHAAVTDKNEKKYRMTEYRLETRKERAVGWKSTSDNASNIPLPRPKTQNKIPAGLIRAHRAGGRIPMNFKVCSNLDTMERAGTPYACPRPFNNDRKIRLVEETTHNLQYALGSVRMPVSDKRQNDQLGLWFNRSVRLAPAD